MKTKIKLILFETYTTQIWSSGLAWKNLFSARGIL